MHLVFYYVHSNLIVPLCKAVSLPSAFNNTIPSRLPGLLQGAQGLPAGTTQTSAGCGSLLSLHRACSHSLLPLEPLTGR